MTSWSVGNHSSARVLTLVFLAVGIVGAGCRSASKAKGDGGGASDDGGADVPQGAAGTGGAAGGSGQAGSGGHPAGGSGGQGGTGGGTSLPACPGVDPTPASQACRTSADCPGMFATCGPTYHSAGCGACLPAQQQCSGDAGCSPEMVCVLAANPCNCNFTGGPATVCTPRCTATSCGAGQSCDTAGGLCKPTPCGPEFACGAGLICAPTRAGAEVHGCSIASCATDGYACPTGYACTPGAAADANGCSPVSCVGGGFQCPSNSDCKAASTAPHHCERRACTSDKSCDCGACIQGSCQDRFYVCSPPPAA
jgi:hypothetical protein